MSIITSDKFAPARTLLADRLKRVMRADIKIADGAHATDSGEIPSNKSLCIMEATAYILGYEYITDQPPCTSGTIRDFMIGINDWVGNDRKRAQLKKVIPEIVNTAPTNWKKRKTWVASHSDPITGEWIHGAHKMIDRLETVDSDPRYKAAEKKRQEMVHTFQQSFSNNDDNMFDFEDALPNIPMTKILPFILELAAVAKFDKANAEADLV